LAVRALMTISNLLGCSTVPSGSRRGASLIPAPEVFSRGAGGMIMLITRHRDRKEENAGCGRVLGLRTREASVVRGIGVLPVSPD
jgi:hypothetical protein